MRREWIRGDGLALVGWRLGVALAYFGSAKLGLTLAFTTASVTAVWPPTGIALAALVLGGRGLWPGVALGAFAANVTTDVPVYTAAGIAAGNTLEAVIGAALLERFDFRPTLRRLRDIFALVVLAGAISTAVSATIGIASLGVGDSLSGGAVSAWRVWWLGDMGGDLLVASFLFVAFTHWPYRDLPGRALEGVALLVGLVGVAVIVFSHEAPALYLTFPFLVWAGLRFLQVGASGSALMLAAIAVAFTANDSGPLVRVSQDDSLLLAQSFSAVSGLTALILAVLTDQRRRAESRARGLAHELQRELLPATIPEVPGFEIAGWYRAGAREQEAGGDFYDVFEAAEGEWVAVVGDACGKGPQSAALTALARYTLRAARERPLGASESLMALNQAVLDQRQDSRFITAVLLRLTVGEGEPVMVLSNGGHPHPLLARVDGTVEEAGPGGTLLGVWEEPALHEQRLDLAPGEVLVMFTDGLKERRDPALEPTGRMLELLRTATSLPAGEIAVRLGGLAQSAGEEADDDVAILVLRRSGRSTATDPA